MGFADVIRRLPVAAITVAVITAMGLMTPLQARQRTDTPPERTVVLLQSLSAQIVEAQQTGNGQEALRLARESAGLAKRAFGVGDPRTAVALSNLALFLDMQSRPGEAEPLYREALAILKEALGAEAPVVATVRNNLAGAVFAQCRLKEAQALYALSHAALVRTVGPRHPDARAAAVNLQRLESLLPASRAAVGGAADVGGMQERPARPALPLPRACALS